MRRHPSRSEILALFRSLRLKPNHAHVHLSRHPAELSVTTSADGVRRSVTQVVNGTSPESLLNAYQDERHPVAARALQHTMAQGALQRQLPEALTTWLIHDGDRRAGWLGSLTLLLADREQLDCQSGER
jgi:hypothetical protein